MTGALFVAGVLNFLKLVINKPTLSTIKYQAKALLQKSLKPARVMAIKLLKIDTLIHLEMV